MQPTTYRTGTGLVLPRLGQGTWEMGVARENRALEVRALRLGLDLGMRLIDTAEMYANGGAEEVVGEAIAGQRDSVFLVSKVLPENASRQGTINACERSLRRLRVESLDLYLLHWPGRHLLAETLTAFVELQQRGKIRGYGLSNFDWQQMAEPGLSANQVYYNLHRRGCERQLLPECRRRKIAFMAYTPLEQGKLPRVGDSASESALLRVAERHDKTPAQVALAFVLRHECVIAIPKAVGEAHVRENAAALSFELSSEDLAELDREFPQPDHDVPLETL